MIYKFLQVAQKGKTVGISHEIGDWCDFSTSSGRLLWSITRSDVEAQVSHALLVRLDQVQTVLFAVLNDAVRGGDSEGDVEGDVEMMSKEMWR